MRETLDEPATGRPGSLAGQVAIVTGGGSGIGRAICLRFAAAGASVVVVDLAGEAAAGVAREVAAAGGAAIDCAADVSQAHSAAGAVACAHERFGRIDVLVNSAGAISVEPLLEVTAESWRRIFAVNVEGPLLMTQAAVRIMAGQAPHAATGCRGKVINVSSAAAEEGRPPVPAYGASKAALNHLSKTCAQVFAPDAIGTTVLYPGDVADGMWARLPEDFAAFAGVSAEEVVAKRIAASPLGRFQAASEVAELALFVAARPGLELNGSLLWTIPHAQPL